MTPRPAADEDGKPVPGPGPSGPAISINTKRLDCSWRANKAKSEANDLYIGPLQGPGSPPAPAPSLA